MSDNDENNVLNGTVDEVKQAVRDMEDPDYADLLKREKGGKDRKTIRDFLAKKANGQEVELRDSKKDNGSTQQSDEEFDSSKLMLTGAGVVIGLLIGLAAGQMIGGGSSGNPQVAANNVESLITSGQFNGSVDVGNPQLRNQMYYFNITLTQEGINGTEQTRQQTAFVSKDGVLLFPENPLTGTPINMPQQIRRAQQAAQNTTAPAP